MRGGWRENRRVRRTEDKERKKKRETEINKVVSSYSTHCPVFLQSD
jgi:hypothetical protein